MLLVIKQNKTKLNGREIYNVEVWLSSFYIDLTAMVLKSFNFTKPAKLYTSTNSSHLLTLNFITKKTNY